jgi:hypothetical protein
MRTPLHPDEQVLSSTADGIGRSEHSPDGGLRRAVLRQDIADNGNVTTLSSLREQARESAGGDGQGGSESAGDGTGGTGGTDGYRS